MLFINDNVVTVEEFVKKVQEVTNKKIDLSDLKKNPSFNRNDVHKAFNLAVFKTTGNKTPTVNQGDDVFSMFRYFDGNEQFEFRWASKHPYRNRNLGDKLIYEPKAIDLADDDFSFDAGRLFDQAVYIYCHPACADSPFYKEDNVARYSHASLTKEISRKSSKAAKLQESLKFIDRLAESEVKIFAKGLGIDLNEHWGTEDIRVELRDFAIDNTESFYKSTQLETVKFDGMIQDAIDNGSIASKVIADTTVWFWGKGQYKDLQITAVPRGVGDVVTFLKNHIKENIAQYDDILVNMNKSSYANLKSEEYLQAKKAGVVPTTEYQSSADVMTLEEVVDFKSSKEFLKLTHPNNQEPAPKNAKAFLDGVLSGNITNENINDVVWDFIPAVK